MTLYAPKHRTPRAAFRAPGAFASVHMRDVRFLHREVHTEEITRAGLGFAARVVFLQINQAEVLHICGGLEHQVIGHFFAVGQFIFQRHHRVVERIQREGVIIVVAADVAPLQLKVGIIHGDRFAKGVLHLYAANDQTVSLRGSITVIFRRARGLQHRIIEEHVGQRIADAALRILRAAVSAGKQVRAAGCERQCKQYHGKRQRDAFRHFFHENPSVFLPPELSPQARRFPAFQSISQNGSICLFALRSWDEPRSPKQIFAQ